MVKPFRSVPGPRGIPLLGSALSYTPLGRYCFERLYEAKREHYLRYGPLYKEKLGPGVTLVQVFHPDDIATVFRSDGRIPMRPPIPITITANRRDGIPLGMGSMNGEDWYRVRQCVHQLMMRPGAAAHYLPAQCHVADDLVQVTGRYLQQTTGLMDLLCRYATESIGVVCFGKRLGCFDVVSEDSSHLGQQMFQATSAMFQAVQKTTFAFPWYMFFRTRLYQQFLVNKKKCDKIARTLIEEALQKVDVGDAMFVRSLASVQSITTGDIVQLITELFTAGIDSTANALGFLLYNLATNEDKQRCLQQEIDKVLGNRRGHVTAEEITSMKYLKACVLESFRLNFPVEGGTTRILSQDIELRGYHIPKGTIIALNNQTTCLEAAFFGNPDVYLPERWLLPPRSGREEQSLCTHGLKDPPKFVMLPFGYGARMCIGRRFAEQEIYLALIKILQSFHVVYTGAERVRMVNRVFTTPDKPIQVELKPRSEST